MGQPIAFGMAFVAFLVVCFSRYLSVYPVTLVHEGGHMIANLVLQRGNKGWKLEDNADGETEAKQARGWLVNNIVSVLGYAMPPLLGLAAAALIAAGNPWAVLIASIFLSVLAVALSRNGLAFLIPALIVIGLGWLLLAGSGSLQAAVAVGIAWLLLFGGLLQAFRHHPSADADDLAKATLIPRTLWTLGWLFVGLVAVIIGGQLLLRPGYGIG